MTDNILFRFDNKFMLPNGNFVDVHTNESGCIICRTHLNSDGYPIFHCKSIKTGTIMLSHFIFKAYTGMDIPKGWVIRHKCDNPACINPGHLELGTHSDNVGDRVRRNRSARGSKHGRAKLNERKVRYIKNHPEISGKEFARRYGVDKMVIYRIRNGTVWVHV